MHVPGYQLLPTLSRRSSCMIVNVQRVSTLLLKEKSAQVRDGRFGIFFSNMSFKMWPSRHTPEPDDVEDRLLENEKGDEFSLPPFNDTAFHKTRQATRWWTWVLQGAIFCSSLTLFVLSRYSEPSDAACTRKLFAYCSSPPQRNRSDFRADSSQPPPSKL
jgi:hypothetical protein